MNYYSFFVAFFTTYSDNRINAWLNLPSLPYIYGQSFYIISSALYKRLQNMAYQEILAVADKEKG